MNTADWTAERPDEVAVLATFVLNMRRELAANSGKGDRPGWMSDTPRSLLAEIQHHYVKLHAVVVEWERWAQGYEARQVPWARIQTAHDLTTLIAEFAADVANMSMMLADRCGALPHGLPAFDAAVARRDASYVPCSACEGDGCIGPNPAEDGCKRCGGSGCEPGIFGPAGRRPEDVGAGPE